MNRTYIGIDMGTSGMKTLLMDENRQVIAQAERSYEVSHPGKGWGETDPQVWYQAMMECLQELLSDADPRKVDVIGITGQMHTLVLVDAQGESVRPALMWNDTRTKDLIPGMKETMRSFPEGAYLSGIVSTGSPAANLLWVARNEPESLAKTAGFMIGPDYLVFRLTGNAGTDYCEASTSSLYEIGARRWSKEMREMIGLPESIYPKVRGCGTSAGTVIPEICNKLGLREDVRVLAGTGDNPAAAMATGSLGGGYPVLSLGSSGVFMFPIGSLEEAGRGKIILISQDGEQFSYLVQGAVQSTGVSVSWWTEKILGTKDYAALTTALTPEKRRAPGVMYYPHLTGDKTIYADPTLRGAFIGLGADTSKEDMYYAVLEGLSFAFRELAEKMRIPLKSLDVLRVVGGGSRSDVWMQTLANVLEVPAMRVGAAGGAAYGIALLARSAGTGEPLGSEEKNESANQVFRPEPEMIPCCRQRYQQYLRIHDALKSVQGE